MLTFGEAQRGFETYLDNLGISPDLCGYYSRAVYRRVLVQLFHRLPCSRYRPLAAHDFMAGVTSASMKTYQSLLDGFHSFPAKAGGLAFLTMGDWIDAYLEAQQERELTNTYLRMVGLLNRLARSYVALLPVSVLDRRLCKELWQWSLRQDKTPRTALRHFFRYLQEQGLVSFQFFVPRIPKWRREVDALLAQGPGRVTPTTPLPDTLTPYLHFCANATNATEQGLRAVYQHLRAFFAWLDANGLHPVVSQLDLTLVNQWLSYQQQDRGNSTRTLHRNLAVLKGLAEFLVTEGAATGNSLVDLVIKLPPPTGPDSVLSPPEMEQLIAVPRELCRSLLQMELLTRAGRVRLFAAARDWAVLELLCHAGIRSAELRTLAVQDLDRHGYLRIRGKGSHSFTKKERRVYLETDEMVEALQIYLQLRPDGHGPTLFLTAHTGLPLQAGDVRQIVAKAARATGLTKRVYPHRLRASFASALVAAGVDPLTLQGLMGHASVVTTLKSYTDLEEAELREIWKRTNPLAHLLPPEKEGEHHD